MLPPFLKNCLSSLLLRFLEAAIPSRRQFHPSLSPRSNPPTPLPNPPRNDLHLLPSRLLSKANPSVSPFTSIDSLADAVGSVAFSNGLVPFPTTEPSHHNACNDPCDMLVGPCACGAWHSVEEQWVRDVLWKMTSSKPTPESTAG